MLENKLCHVPVVKLLVNLSVVSQLFSPSTLSSLLQGYQNPKRDISQIHLPIGVTFSSANGRLKGKRRIESVFLLQAPKASAALCFSTLALGVGGLLKSAGFLQSSHRDNSNPATVMFQKLRRTVFWIILSLLFPQCQNSSSSGSYLWITIHPQPFLVLQPFCKHFLNNTSNIPSGFSFPDWILTGNVTMDK